MAPSAVRTHGYSLTTVEDPDESRPSKRLRLHEAEHEHELLETLPSHPLGIKPSGNLYTASINHKAAAGRLAGLSDELIISTLELLPARALVSLGSTCKALYAFSRAEELWRTLFIASPPSDFKWHGTWRSTYLRLPSDKQAHVQCDNLFSDVLYRPFQCAVTSLQPYAAKIPSANRIARLTNLTQDEFSTDWIDKPFILTEPVKDWPIYRQWSTETLLKCYSDIHFRAEAVDWPLQTYVSYMQNNTDESPLYLFDRAFATKMKLDMDSDSSNKAYQAPICFGEDLFTVLGPQRPDSRWLIMGPARSGSTFHKDPNATSAWNAVITGSKYWLMFPSSANLPPPPGVIISDDGSEITSPLSIAEYLLTFHALARETPGCREGVCYAGEVLHVPSGWFHLVLNLEPGIAVTQNFVPEKKLLDVMLFLRDTPDQVSGFQDDVVDPYALFVERLREAGPDVLEKALARLEKRDKGKSRGKWEALTKDAGESGGFSFGFGGDEDEEIP